LGLSERGRGWKKSEMVLQCVRYGGENDIY
jgi:hypothetical protein